ncbi:MAG: Bax inhibitor-1 family protein [Elusimicrobiota bacterium]|nr:Bax inhibitor-1 family protein [Elusimicrobiota bacterium]
MFETLAAKTFLILAASLFTAYIASRLSGAALKKALDYGNISKAKNMQITAMIVNIAAFVALMFLQHKMPLNMVLMFVFTFSSGWTLGIYALRGGDAVQKAVALTGFITLLGGLVATYSGLDFAWMGKFLFIALIVLVVISIARLFVKIEKGRRFIAAFGVLIFTGYLLFDFNRLAKLKDAVGANTWNTALDIAVSLYLDIINLFLQLVDLLSSGNN